jgi:hypothetical protein
MSEKQIVLIPFRKQSRKIIFSKLGLPAFTSFHDEVVFVLDHYALRNHIFSPILSTMSITSLLYV